jgi:multiple sugar transport system substrate-binding protein
MRTVPPFLAGALAMLVLAACGGSDAGGPAQLKYYIFNEPSGAFADAAKRCSENSGGRYRVTLQALPNEADAQRQNLVRRLSAQDSDIDLMGMDVIWTAEFAEAGWVAEWTGADKAAVERGTLEGPLQTATYQGRLYAAPANTNTQLLWYRKDLVDKPPATWDEMIDMATKLREAGRIEVQGRQYEGLTVWFNSLLQSAGGEVLRGPESVALGAPAERATGIMQRLATSSAASPSLSQSTEDTARLAFQEGSAAFMVNYPFVFPRDRKSVV